MTSIWLHFVPAIAVHTLALLAVATLAARLRFSAPSRAQRVLDVVFLLPLALPLELASGICWNIFLVEAGSMLPILYLCAIAGFRNVRRETLDAARLQGMGPCGTFWRFFVPEGKYWLLGGVALVAVRWVLVIITALMTCHPA